MTEKYEPWLDELVKVLTVPNRRWLYGSRADLEEGIQEGESIQLVKRTGYSLLDDDSWGVFPLDDPHWGAIPCYGHYKAYILETISGDLKDKLPTMTPLKSNHFQ